LEFFGFSHVQIFTAALTAALFEIKPPKWHLCAENERRVRIAPACGLLETPAGYEPKELRGCAYGCEKKAGNERRVVSWRRTDEKSAGKVSSGSTRER
jgi:hypothetical protein